MSTLNKGTAKGNQEVVFFLVWHNKIELDVKAEQSVLKMQILETGSQHIYAAICTIGGGSYKMVDNKNTWYQKTQ